MDILYIYNCNLNVQYSNILNTYNLFNLEKYIDILWKAQSFLQLIQTKSLQIHLFVCRNDWNALIFNFLSNLQFKDFKIIQMNKMCF